MNFNIDPERREELEKHAITLVETEVDFMESMRTRTLAIQSLARIALGLETDRDITDLDSSTRDELLSVMRTMRDIVFPPQPDDTIETI